MVEYLVFGEFIVAFLMGLAALSAFVWALASGAFRDVEETKKQVLRREGGDDDLQGA